MTRDEDGSGLGDQPQKKGWLARLGQGLARTSNALSDNLTSVLSRRKLDAETLDELEEVLIKADLGVAMAARIRDALGATRQDRGLSAPRLARGARRRDRQGAGAGGRAADPRGGCPPARDPPRRRQRHRQDHHGGKARAALHARRQDRDAGGGGHLPRRGHRSAQGLGPPRRRRGRGQGCRRRSRGGRLRGARARQGRGPRCAHHRYRRALAEQVGSDGRARQDRARVEEARRRTPRTASSSCSTPPPGRTPSIKCRSFRRSPASPAWS